MSKDNILFKIDLALERLVADLLDDKRYLLADTVASAKDDLSAVKEILAKEHKT